MSLSLCVIPGSGGGGDVEGGVRRVDGEVRAPEDLQILHPHEVLRAGAPAARLLQEEASRHSGSDQDHGDRWQL